MNKQLIIFILISVVEISAIAAISYGAWLHYQPLGFIVGGGLIWFEVNQNVFKKSNRTEGA